MASSFAASASDAARTGDLLGLSVGKFLWFREPVLFSFGVLKGLGRFWGGFSGKGHGDVF